MVNFMYRPRPDLAGGRPWGPA